MDKNENRTETGTADKRYSERQKARRVKSIAEEAAELLTRWASPPPGREYEAEYAYRFGWLSGVVQAAERGNMFARRERAVWALAMRVEQTGGKLVYA